MSRNFQLVRRNWPEASTPRTRREITDTDFFEQLLPYRVRPFFAYYDGALDASILELEDSKGNLVWRSNCTGFVDAICQLAELTWGDVEKWMALDREC